MTPTANDWRIARLAALAITIHIAESVLPSPIPGVKLGLANVVTLLVLLTEGWQAAAWVSVLRVIGGSIAIGTFLSPTFILSASGAILSLGTLGLAKISRIGFGPVGYSLIAAIAHMVGQFLIAYTWLVPHPGLMHLLPILLTAAVVFGVITGIITAATLQHLRVK